MEMTSQKMMPKMKEAIRQRCMAEARTEALKVAGDQTATVDEDGWKQEPRGVVPTEESLAAVATLRYSKLRHKRNDD